MGRELRLGFSLGGGVSLGAFRGASATCATSPASSTGAPSPGGAQWFPGPIPIDCWSVSALHSPRRSRVGGV